MEILLILLKMISVVCDLMLFLNLVYKNKEGKKWIGQKSSLGLS